MISIAQCRGARGLLDWTQQDLADSSGLSKTAINNFEKENSDIKHDSLRAIRMAFEACGIEFLDEDGVRLRRERAHVFSGTEALQRLHDDIVFALRGRGGEVLVIAGDESAATETPAVKLQRSRMKDLDNRFRTMVPDTTREGGFTVYFYDERMAFVLAGGQTVVVLEGSPAIDSERLRFAPLTKTSIEDKSRNTRT